MPDRDFPASRLFSRFFSGSKKPLENRDYPTSDPRQKQHPITSRDRRREVLIKGRQGKESTEQPPITKSEALKLAQDPQQLREGEYEIITRPDGKKIIVPKK